MFESKGSHHNVKWQYKGLKSNLTNQYLTAAELCLHICGFSFRQWNVTVLFKFRTILPSDNWCQDTFNWF